MFSSSFFLLSFFLLLLPWHASPDHLLIMWRSAAGCCAGVTAAWQAAAGDSAVGSESIRPTIVRFAKLANTNNFFVILILFP